MKRTLLVATTVLTLGLGIGTAQASYPNEIIEEVVEVQFNYESRQSLLEEGERFMFYVETDKVGNYLFYSPKGKLSNGIAISPQLFSFGEKLSVGDVFIYETNDKGQVTKLKKVFYKKNSK